MKQCPKCNKEHEKSGKFCSRSCANSRVRTDDVKRKISKSVKKFAAGLSNEVKQEQCRKASETSKKNKIHKIKNELFEKLSKDLQREKILYEQEQKCSICNIEQQWNNKPLKFHLDHISGVRTDNSRQNLRMICPNCHSQTETYCSKNGSKVSNEQIVRLLEKETTINNHQLCLRLGINPSKRSYERINKLRP